MRTWVSLTDFFQSAVFDLSFHILILHVIITVQSTQDSLYCITLILLLQNVHTFFVYPPTIRISKSMSYSIFIAELLLIIFMFYLPCFFSTVSDNDQLDTQLLYFILQCVYYNPVYVSNIICSSSGSLILLMQHLVSSLSEGDCPVHRLRENSDFSLNLCTGRSPSESNDTRCCINTIKPYDDEHLMLETCIGL